MNIFKKIFMNESTEKFLKDEDHRLKTTNVDEIDIEKTLDNITPTGFYDDGSKISYSFNDKITTLQHQRNLIETYRKLSNRPDISEAINIITDEAIYTHTSEDLLSVKFDVDYNDDSIKEAINKELVDISSKMNLDKNIYSLFSRFYVDGQLNVHVDYIDSKVSEGIQGIRIITPFNLYFDKSSNKWKYEQETTNMYGQQRDLTSDTQYSREDIIRIDSGIYSDNLILSNLHTAIKPSNMVDSMESLLPIMRHNRSVMRRVFHIDVSKLSNAKAEKVIEEHRRRFKSRQHYNADTGEISLGSNEQNLLETYYLPNRDGSKSSSLEFIQERNSDDNLEDVKLLKKNTKKALKIPDKYFSDSDDKATFDYSTDSMDAEDIRFFNFISRLRRQFLDLFYELLRRQLVSKNILNDDEYLELKKSFKIYFTSENVFFERQKREKMKEKIDLLNEYEEVAGKYVSYEYIFKEVLDFSDSEIDEQMEAIEKEKKSKRYKSFYASDEDF